jgi:hypothetical protein
MTHFTWVADNATDDVALCDLLADLITVINLTKGSTRPLRVPPLFMESFLLLVPKPI